MFRKKCSQNSGGRERFKGIAFWKFAMMRPADVLPSLYQIPEGLWAGFHFVVDMHEQD
jgi:hypothetical protein